MRADDKLIIQNYRSIFTSSLSQRLPVPVFSSADNKDFYDMMMAEGAYIQLDSFLSNPKTTPYATALAQGIKDYQGKKMTAKGQSNSLETLEEDVAQRLSKISEKRPELSEPIQIMNLKDQVKDIASRRKLDALFRSKDDGGHGKQTSGQMTAQPQDVGSAETIKKLQDDCRNMKKLLCEALEKIDNIQKEHDQLMAKK